MDAVGRDQSERASSSVTPFCGIDSWAGTLHVSNDMPSAEYAIFAGRLLHCRSQAFTSTASPGLARLATRAAFQLVRWIQPFVTSSPTRSGAGVPWILALRQGLLDILVGERFELGAFVHDDQRGGEGLAASYWVILELTKSGAPCLRNTSLVAASHFPGGGDAGCLLKGSNETPYVCPEAAIDSSGRKPGAVAQDLRMHPPPHLRHLA